MPDERLSVAERFRREITAATQAGREKGKLVLRLTLRDHDALRRDPGVAVDELSFRGGLHFLGVRVVGGRGVEASVLEQAD
jgi:hypothetical protein